jgi:asparagine synthase (glutamine-hydrolysing)
LTFCRKNFPHPIYFIFVYRKAVSKTMCGIFGILNKDGSPVDIDLVQHASRMLNHRGPDGEGFFVEANIGFGHKRLSIIDLSADAKQPFDKHGLVIIYNGEIYNYKELRKELVGLGYNFRSNSDTEVLLSAYHCWGNKAFEKLNGMWALAIWDKKERSLLFSRDRYGMKPLFVFENEEFVAFASEIKAFSALTQWSGQINRENAYDFLVSGQLNHNSGTFYEQVKSIEKASVQKYSSYGALMEQLTFYNIDKRKRKAKANTERFRQLFSNAVASHYVADVKVVTALSGGMDSSSIVAVSKAQDRFVESFSYAASEEEYSEFEYVELLEKKLKFKSHSISPSFQEHLEAHRSALIANEAPCLALNLITSYLLYKEVARQNFKVLLAGQGADELLLGYSFYYVPFLKHFFKHKPILFLRESASLLMRYPKASLRALLRSLERPEFHKYVKGSKREGQVGGVKSFQDFYENNIGYGQLYGLLQYEDRLSMAHGVEARLPFLDAEFSNYTHGIPFDQKIVGALRKMPLRKAMKGIVPSAILERRDKMGYLTPEEKWIGENEAYFRERILEGVRNHSDWFTSELSSFLDRAFQDKSNYGFIWRVYSFLEFLEVKL